MNIHYVYSICMYTAWTRMYFAMILRDESYRSVCLIFHEQSFFKYLVQYHMIQNVHILYLHKEWDQFPRKYLEL